MPLRLLASLLVLACAQYTFAQPASPEVPRLPARVILDGCDAPQELMASARTISPEAFSDPDAAVIAIAYTVSSSGQVLGSEVLSKSVNRRLALAAARHFRNCRFSPATQGGLAVDGTAVVQIRLGGQYFEVRSLARCLSPEYPIGPMRNGIEGTSVVRLSFSADGKVIDPQLSASSGNSELDQASLSAANKCTPLEKYRAGGQGQIIEVMFRWRL